MAVNKLIGLVCSLAAIYLVLHWALRVSVLSQRILENKVINLKIQLTATNTAQPQTQLAAAQANTIQIEIDAISDQIKAYESQRYAATFAAVLQFLSLFALLMK